MIFSLKKIKEILIEDFLARLPEPETKTTPINMRGNVFLVWTKPDWSIAVEFNFDSFPSVTASIYKMEPDGDLGDNVFNYEYEVMEAGKVNWDEMENLRETFENLYYD